MASLSVLKSAEFWNGCLLQLYLTLRMTSRVWGVEKSTVYVIKAPPPNFASNIKRI